jgi:hypothetical protein
MGQGRSNRHPTNPSNFTTARPPLADERSRFGSTHTCMGRFLSRGCPKGPIHFFFSLSFLVRLVWGDFCQGGAPRVLSIFSFPSVSLFDLIARFFASTHAIE